MLTKINGFIFLTLIMWLTSGCSGMLYYPSRSLLSNPSQYKLAPYDVWFKSEDGTRLNGWYFTHRDYGPSRGLIVFFHGNGENLSSHYQTLVWTLDHGYDFFIFDYRGYGRSAGSPSPEGTVNDGKAALRWAWQQAGSKPLIVFGQSLGGAVAMRTVIDLKSEIPVKVVVVESTFASYQAVARKVLGSNIWTWLFQPLAYVVLSDKYAPGKDIAKISPIPMIVIHGTEDYAVDESMGRQVFEYAREPKEFWEVEGGGHIEAFWRFGSIYRPKLLGALSRLITYP